MENKTNRGKIRSPALQARQSLGRFVPFSKTRTLLPLAAGFYHAGATQDKCSLPLHWRHGLAPTWF
jgi:hypothetical protein